MGRGQTKDFRTNAFEIRVAMSVIRECLEKRSDAKNYARQSENVKKEEAVNPMNKTPFLEKVRIFLYNALIRPFVDDSLLFVAEINARNKREKLLKERKAKEEAERLRMKAEWEAECEARKKRAESAAYSQGSSRSYHNNDYSHSDSYANYNSNSYTSNPYTEYKSNYGSGYSSSTNNNSSSQPWTSFDPYNKKGTTWFSGNNIYNSVDGHVGRTDSKGNIYNKYGCWIGKK